MSADRTSVFLRGTGFCFIFLFQVWLAHAVAYLAHEYAHTFIAWVFRAKANPFALDYGHLSWQNIIYLSDIDENVDYDPIFAANRGWLAALIAVSGVLFGNGLGYLLSRRLYASAKAAGKRMLALFLFLFCMMNTGNFLSYVPNRTFTTHADMATVERGLNIGPWWIAIILGVPFCVAVVHFFVRILPDAMNFFFPGWRVAQILLLLFTAYVVFEFFGASGLYRYGEISHRIAAASVYVLFPLSILLCWPRANRIKPSAA